MTQELDDTTALAKQIITLSKRVLELETQLKTVNATCETFAKLAQHATTCNPENVKAEMSELTNRFAELKQSLATGRGMQQPTTFAKEDFASMRDERIAQASLAEIAQLLEGGN